MPSRSWLTCNNNKTACRNTRRVGSGGEGQPRGRVRRTIRNAWHQGAARFGLTSATANLLNAGGVLVPKKRLTGSLSTLRTYMYPRLRPGARGARGGGERGRGRAEGRAAAGLPWGRTVAERMLQRVRCSQRILRDGGSGSRGREGRGRRGHGAQGIDGAERVHFLAAYVAAPPGQALSRARHGIIPTCESR